MEVFAFTHAATAFEDQGPEPQLRQFDELNLEVPKSALLAVAGTAAALSVMGAAPDAQALVRPGESCAAVGSIQQALLSAGFSPGGIDNVYGPNTTAAVRNFQSFRGLLVDGIVGPSTASALGLDPGITCGGGTGGGGFFTVTASSGVVVRSGPGLGFAVVGSAGNGERLELTTERVARDGYLWGRIVNGNWVATNFLTAVGNGDTGGNGGTGGGGNFVVTATSGLAVRSGPSLGNAVLYFAANGSTLSLTSERVARDGFTWARLTTGGWAATEFLSAGGGGGGGGGGNLPSGSGTFFVDASSGVNVRSTPGLGGGILYSVGPGQAVTITSERVARDGYLWARLTTGGWIATDFLS